MTAVPATLLGDPAFAVSEEISARDLNNLYLTSCYFRDRERFQAFCGLYALMRVIDDRVDAIADRGALSASERAGEHAVVDAWRHAFLHGELDREAIAACSHPQALEILQAASRAMALFPVPTSLWENFFVAMHADLDQARFATYGDFLAYTEGASVAPTTIYLFLLAANRPAVGEPYTTPAEFDLIGCGRHLGTFAYLAHILRDLAEDLLATEAGLIYVALDDLARHGLGEEELREDLAAGRGRPALRALTAELTARARDHHADGRALLAPLRGRIEPDCAYILELIVEIYDEILRRIEACGFDPMTGRHQLSLDDKQAIAARVAERVGFEP
jgi:phytoene/squalene synthetase